MATYSIEWCGSLGQIINEILRLLLNQLYTISYFQHWRQLDVCLVCNIRIPRVAGP